MEGMKNKGRLNLSESILIGSLLFGLFFGAGNLIFPIKMGQLAGNNVWIAVVGFLITGVGLPVLGIIGSALSKSRSMLEMTAPAGKVFAVAFTCLLYLTIGPLFAIPRTATVSFEVGLRPFVDEKSLGIGLVIFSVIFFALTLYFSLKPGRIIDWVGKYLTPLFLILLSVLIILSIAKPMSGVSALTAKAPYDATPLVTGFLDGYNTMDALASLAFAIIIIDNIAGLGISSPERTAKETFKSGLFSMLGMSVIYAALAYIGATSVPAIGEGENGGIILSLVSNHYLGLAGQILLAGIVIVACLKTAIGLITACSEMFASMFKGSLSYRGYAILFTAMSFVIANFGLSNIISFSIPMLMFLYPISMVTIILSLLSFAIKRSRIIYSITLGITALVAIFDLVKYLPAPFKDSVAAGIMVGFAEGVLPLYELGLGWLLPAAVGLLLGSIIEFVIRKNKPKQ